MSRDLKDLPGPDTLFPGELGAALDAEAGQLFYMPWPECFVSMSTGEVVMSDEDRTLLEKLYRRWGVPLKVRENSEAVLLHAFDTFALSFQMHITRRLRRPEDFRQMTTYWNWPKEWVAYFDAVAAGDEKGARALAMNLQPLSPDCRFPEGVMRYNINKKAPE